MEGPLLLALIVLAGFALARWVRDSTSVWWTTVLPLALGLFFLWHAATGNDDRLVYLFFGLMGVGLAAPGTWGLGVFGATLGLTTVGLVLYPSLTHGLTVLVAAALAWRRWKEVMGGDREGRARTADAGDPFPRNW